MKIGPKYKIARRLGAPVFEKTQSQKYAISESKKDPRRGKRRKQITDYGLQMLEKQKARYSYLMTEKQFSTIVKKSMKQKNPAESMFTDLELRLDSIINRSGWGPSRSFCRQIISHGHIMVNGQRVTIPSYKVSEGDVISIKPSSLEKGVFADLPDRMIETSAPTWIQVDMKKKELTLKSQPKSDEVDLLFDINSVLEFYSR